MERGERGQHDNGSRHKNCGYGSLHFFRVRCVEILRRMLRASLKDDDEEAGHGIYAWPEGLRKWLELRIAKRGKDPMRFTKRRPGTRHGR